MAKAKQEIRSLARSHTDSAIMTLAKIMTSPKAPTSARVSAATALLDRGWGKPRQAMELMAPPKKPEEMTDDELDARIAETLAEIDEITGRIGETAAGEADEAPSEEEPASVH